MFWRPGVLDLTRRARVDMALWEGTIMREGRDAAKHTIGQRSRRSELVTYETTQGVKFRSCACFARAPNQWKMFLNGSTSFRIFEQALCAEN